VGLFLTVCCVVTNNRKLMAHCVVGQEAVPPGQAADCPHHGCTLRKHQIPLKAPAADTGGDGRHNPEPKPSRAPHPT